jgi:gliding motility-associated-like protein
MKSLRILLLCVAFTFPVAGQNLVPNGDFSQMIEPPDFQVGILHKCFESWFAPTKEGHFSGVISYRINELGYTGVPNTPPRFYISPSVDSSYCTFLAFDDLSVNGGENSRSYLSTRLLETVHAGLYYRFSMDFHLLRSPHATQDQYSNNIGMAFTDSLSKKHWELISVPTAFNVDTPVMTPNTWFSVDTCLIASRSADFMTIGNFFNDSNTIVNTNSSLSAAFAVDNIFLEHLQLTLNTGDTVFGCSHEPLILEATKDCWYKWARKDFPNVILEEGPSFEISPTRSETYMVYGLTDTLEVYVEIDDRIGVRLDKEVPLCEGDSVQFDLSRLHADRIYWSTGDTTEQVTIKEPGQYYVQVERGNCTEIDSVNVYAETPPEADITLEKEAICYGEEQILKLLAFRPGYQLRWSTNDTEETISIRESGLYYVEAENGCGIDYDTLYVEIEPCTCSVYIPTAFRPNSHIDANRVFGPTGECVYTDFSLQIFNRWGSLVFESRDANKLWDGHLPNGQICPMGVYSYTFTYSGFNERGLQTQEIRLGSVALIH